MENIIYFLVTILTLVILDILWIGLIAKSFYKKTMVGIFSQKMNLNPALIFYPIYALAILLLAVLPAVYSLVWIEALWRGAILGLASYSAYDLTNQVTISSWPTKMTIVDICWGIFVTAISSSIAYFIILLIK